MYMYEGRPLSSSYAWHKLAIRGARGKGARNKVAISTYFRDQTYGFPSMKGIVLLVEVGAGCVVPLSGSLLYALRW